MQPPLGNRENPMLPKAFGSPVLRKGRRQYIVMESKIFGLAVWGRFAGVSTDCWHNTETSKIPWSKNDTQKSLGAPLCRK